MPAFLAPMYHSLKRFVLYLFVFDVFRKFLDVLSFLKSL
jgi:hypothetical protein